MSSMNRSRPRYKIAVKLLPCLFALLFVNGPAYGQGGTGKGTSTSPAKTTTPAKPAAGRNPTVATIEGTTWGFEGREGAKFVGKGVFEFRSGGKLQINGDLIDTFLWKQVGRRVQIDGRDSQGEGEAHFDGLISGNQMNGTWTSREKGGPVNRLEVRARRANSDLVAELGYWKSIKASTNPEDFKAYLEKYPYGAFVADAVGRMRRFEATKSASPSPTP